MPTEKVAKDLDYQTPEPILERVRVFFGGPIPLDPATTSANPTRALEFFTPAEDGLTKIWDRPFFVNPPFGKPLRSWLEKIGQAAAHRQLVGVALLPVNRTEQAYWQDNVLALANALCTIRKRVAFVRPSTGERAKGNPYASVIVGYNAPLRAFEDAFRPLGQVVEVRPT